MKYFISENIKKVLLIFIISFFSIGITSEVVFASSFSSKITIDKKEIREGDEVEVTLSFNNFKDIKKGINSFKGKLDYDNNVFEKVTIDNMKALNNWESLLFNEKINEFITIHKNGVNQKEDVLKLRLKVKYGVLAGQTNIKVENIVASDGKKDITTEDLSIKLEVIEKQDGKPEEDVGNGSDQNNNQQPPDGDYVVDKDKAIHVLQDNYSAYHVGDRNNSSGDKTNYTTIGIELCVNDAKDSKGWEKVKENGIALVAELMERYDIPLERVIMHKDASGKLCSQRLIEDNKKGWEGFKNTLADTIQDRIIKVVKEYDLDIKFGPGVDYSKVGHIPKGTMIEIISEHNGWAKVNFNNQYGYIPSSNLVEIDTIFI